MVGPGAEAGQEAEEAEGPEEGAGEGGGPMNWEEREALRKAQARAGSGAFLVAERREGEGEAGRAWTWSWAQWEEGGAAGRGIWTRVPEGLLAPDAGSEEELG